MKKKWAILLFLITVSILCIAQDAHFSRFYSNPLYLAPSFAGSTGKNRLSASYRNQWPEIEVGYKTYSFAFDHYFERVRSGVGVLFLNDVAGSGNLSTTNFGILYNYDFRISNTVHVRPGMHLLYTQRSIDFNRLLWRDQMSVAGNAPGSGEVVPFERVGDIDFSSSLLAYGDMFWIGFSADHLLRPNQSLYYFEYSDLNLARVPVKVQFFGGTRHIVKQSLLRPTPTVLQWAFLYKKQEDFQQLDLGFYYHYSPVVLGIWYRGVPVVKSNKLNDAIILLAGLKTNQYNIGYSYDFTVSRLITSTGGSHEISVSYTFGKPSKKKKPKKMVPCPEF
ncbi:MAG: PorP/SprF family type IX secretion system membrane protein [Bacteroidales bacterium]|nr:PorP/SprF family type IX secretion system membrane protein [Bacteroidales bacterium]